MTNYSFIDQEELKKEITKKHNAILAAQKALRAKRKELQNLKLFLQEEPQK